MEIKDTESQQSGNAIGDATARVLLDKSVSSPNSREGGTSSDTTEQPESKETTSEQTTTEDTTTTSSTKTDTQPEGTETKEESKETKDDSFPPDGKVETKDTTEDTEDKSKSTGSDNSEGSEEGETKEGEENGEVLNPLSFALPDSDTSSSSSTETNVQETPETLVKFDPASPLKESDEDWKHEAFQRLNADDSLSEDDKKNISQLPPSKWDSARSWYKSHAQLNNFRNAEYPIEQFLDNLGTQSQERSGELKLAVLNDVVGNEEALFEFAESNPETYGRLVVALANSQPDFLVKVLETKGYAVSDAKNTIDVNEIRKQMQESDEWGYMSGTDLEAKVQEVLSTLENLNSKQIDVADVLDKPEENSQEQTQVTPDMEHFTQSTKIAEGLFESWGKDVQKGVASAGLSLPTEEYSKSHPVPALLKKLAYSISINGMEGDIPHWQHGLFEWGKSDPDFTSKHTEVLGMLEALKADEAQSYGRSLSNHAHRYGSLRAKIPAVQALVKLAVELESGSKTTPQVPDTETKRGAESAETTSTAPETKSSGFYSDQRILNSVR